MRPSTPRLTQYWNAIFRACSTATAPSAAKRKCGIVHRHDRREGLGQLDHHGVAVAEHRRVRHLARLRGQGGVELGDAVAQGVHPERGDGVEIAAPVGVDKLAPLGPLDHEGGVVGVGGHLGEAVPDDGGVALDPAPGGLRNCAAHAPILDSGAPDRPMRFLRENGSWT